MKHKILKFENVKFEEIEVYGEVVGYAELRDAIGGCYIERCPYNETLEKNNIDIWCDEEGKLRQLKLECLIIDFNTKKIIDIIAGPLVFTSRDREGNSLALSEMQIETIKQVIDNKSFGIPVMSYR